LTKSRASSYYKPIEIEAILDFKTFFNLQLDPKKTALILIRPVSPDEIALLRLPMVCEAINLAGVISIRR
jgi:hypothetical protein